MSGDRNAHLDGVSVLADGVRRRLYLFVVDQREPVTREQVAAATGVSRALAAYHLDKLAAAGLVDVSFARPDGRAGPGAGRPSKRYARSSREIAVSLPPRNYSLLAQILAGAADASPSGEFHAALDEAARREGRTLGQRVECIEEALATAGYEPSLLSDGDIVLRNCPFHSVVRDHTTLVCNLNRAFIRGVVEATGGDPARAVLSPHEGQCCVIIHPEPEITTRLPP